MPTVKDRFLKYVSFDTASAGNVDTIPSTAKQFDLARELADEMTKMGLSDVCVSDQCYVYGFVPETAPGLPSLGFVAHMDTIPEISGKDVLPRIVENYQGGDIYLNKEISIEESLFPVLKDCIGKDLIVTDGTTLLGADDKAGIAAILTMAEYFLAHPEVRHGRIAIGFTPDEEVGHGPNGFDVSFFGADFAYTVDGGVVGEIEYENFNAAAAVVNVRGYSIHPGSAKDKMINAIHVATEFDAMLPASERPEHTEGYEGFFHTASFDGTVDKASVTYIIRDHDADAFEERKALMRRAAAFINERYGDGTLTLSISDTYRNMKEKILPHLHLIETAKAAIVREGLTPIIKPIRGGTDGATLSYMGLPCPNLGTGGYNFHGYREFIPVQALEKNVEVLKAIVELTYKA